MKQCCDYHGIEFEGTAHSALSDAKASAKLLSLFLNDSDVRGSELHSMPGIMWPALSPLTTKLVTRQSATHGGDTKPTYIQSLIDKTEPLVKQSAAEESLLEYRGLLDYVLEDRVIEQGEGQALVGLAEDWGLSGEQVMQVHEEYLSQLTDAAWADGIVTEAENRDLIQVSNLLGINENRRQAIFAETEKSSRVPRSKEQGSVEEFCGKSVCFTGACQCVVNGERVTRPMSYTLAEKHGMVPAKSVTKKLDFLVVADPYTQSGKARKAKQYGTRILQARVFWRALGLEVT